MTSVSTAAAAAVAAAPPPIDDGHPFDLGLLAKAFDGAASSSCSPDRADGPTAAATDANRLLRPFFRLAAGRALLIRLVHIASLAPSLFPACAALALPLLRTETYDLALFDFFGGKSDDPWRAEAGRKAADEGERLEAELKSVTANLIKESIRVRPARTSGLLALQLPLTSSLVSLASTRLVPPLPIRTPAPRARSHTLTLPASSSSRATRPLRSARSSGRASTRRRPSTCSSSAWRPSRSVWLSFGSFVDGNKRDGVRWG